MYVTNLYQYAIELVTYLLVLVVHFYEFIVYMLLKRNAFGSIAFFSQCGREKINFHGKNLEYRKIILLINFTLA